MVMRRLLITLILLLIAATSHAACDGVENALGVYFDQGTYQENCFEPVVGTPFSMYFVLRHGTLPNFAGVAFLWRFSPEPAQLITSCAWDCGVELWNCREVFLFCEPRPMTDAIVLVNAQCFLLQPLVVASFIQAGPYGEAGVYSDDPYDRVPMDFCDDWDDTDVIIDAEGWTVPGLAAIAPPGGCGTVAVVGATWGSIKSLYQ
jgi:hypothetical protein